MTVPEGVTYREDFVSRGEEGQLLDRIASLEFREVVMHGQAARRTVVHLGVDYDYGSHETRGTEPIPEWLHELRARCGELAGVAPDDLVEALITRYPPGAGIGWHRDAPSFGGKVIGVSLGSECRMRFQRSRQGERETADFLLEPRSAYVLAGPARWSWQHSIPSTPRERHSITFRSLREGSRR